MPSTFREKLIAAVGFAAILVLVALALTGGNDGTGTRTTANPPPPIPSTPVTTAPQPATTPPPATTTGRQPQPGDVRLVITASRGESSVLVRNEEDGEDGESLYEGVLTRGRSVRLFGPQLRIRLGAAENVDLTLDGRPVERLPAGSLDLVATPGQLQAAG